MSTIAVTCPGCGAVYQLSDELVGRKVQCPACETKFYTTGEAVPPSAVTPPRAAPVDGVAAEWQVGDVILDLYEVKQVHEGGGMGLVYRVDHRGWNLDLAVKCPRPDYFQTEQDKENFVREAETWIDLGLHPHIVSCYYVRMLGGIPRVFAEYAQGGSLHDWIADRRLYEGGPGAALERILDVAIQFAWGLDFAHEKGLVHQDVKPANVLMTPEGTAKVTDFGLAKAWGAAGESRSVRAGASILVSSGGMTPAYCSPEQAKGEALSRKTDLWSWAVSLLEMFTGEVLWLSGSAAGESFTEYVAQGEEGPFELPMPGELVGLLQQCFRKEPDERPRTMREVSERLRSIYEQATGQAYARTEPQAAELLADGLNNRAVSLLDLGRREEALGVFEQALAADPHHLEATYNRGLILWRAAKLTDEELVKTLELLKESHRDNWKTGYALGLVHLERGDGQAAEEALRTATEDAEAEAAVNSALQAARICKDNGCRHSRTFTVEVPKVYIENRSVCFSPDGRNVLSMSGRLRLWDPVSGEMIRELEGESGASAAVFSADGSKVLAAGFDHRLRLWDVATGKCLRVFAEGHRYSVESVALAPDNRLALSGSLDETVRLWDVASGECRQIYEDGEQVHSLAFPPSGQFALVASGLALWRLDVTEWRCRWKQKEQADVSAVAIAADGRVALSNSGLLLKLWDPGSGECLGTFRGHSSAVKAVALSADSRLALSGGTDHTLRLWELPSGRCRRTISGLKPEVAGAQLSPDGRFAVSACGRDTFDLWQVALGEAQGLLLCRPSTSRELADQSAEILALKQSARSDLAAGNPSRAYQTVRKALAFPGYSGNRELLDLRREGERFGRASGPCRAEYLPTFEGFTKEVCSTSFSTDGRFVLTGCQYTQFVLPAGKYKGVEGAVEGGLQLWDVTSGRLRCQIDDACAPVTLLPGGKLAIAAGHGRTGLYVWDLESGSRVGFLADGTEGSGRSRATHAGEVEAVASSPDGRLVLSGSYDKTMKLWAVPSGEHLRTYKNHINSVVKVQFSPDGRVGLSVSSDRTACLWDLAGGHLIRQFGRHFGSVMDATFVPDGCLVLAGSQGGQGRLWKVANGQLTQTVSVDTEAVNSVAVSPDGRLGLIQCSNGGPRLGDLSTGKCLQDLEGFREPVHSRVFSPDGSLVLCSSAWHTIHKSDSSLRLWQLVREYEFPGWADWDEGARPSLETFLTLHCPYDEDRISRVGAPAWNEDDFKMLVEDLQRRGYGWLRPAGMRKELEKMTREWQGPPPLTSNIAPQPEREPQAPGPPSPEAQADYDALRAALLPRAEQMLRQHGDFSPFGAAITTAGEVGGHLTCVGEKVPLPVALNELVQVFQGEARGAKIRAAGICFNGWVVQDGKKVRAMVIKREHVSGNASDACVPYTKSMLGKYRFEKTIITTLDEQKIFATD